MSRVGVYTIALVALSALALSAPGHAHPNSGLPPPKFDMHGHGYDSTHGMVRGQRRDNPVLTHRHRTDVNEEEVAAALRFHDKYVERMTDEAKVATPVVRETAEDEEKDKRAAESPYPMDIIDTSPPGADDIAKELMEQGEKRAHAPLP
jgi:hypothetical protein